MFDELLPFEPQASGVRFTVKVTPKAANNRIGSIMREAGPVLLLKVYVTAMPEDGAANTAVIKLLSKSWGLPKGAFEIASGHKDRKKVIHIRGDPQKLMKLLRMCL